MHIFLNTTLYMCNVLVLFGHVVTYPKYITLPSSNLAFIKVYDGYLLRHSIEIVSWISTYVFF